MKVLEGIQGEPWWFEARCGIPTVSEFGRFITPARGDLSKQSTGYIADLIVESVEGPGDQIRSYWMDRGHILEEEARNFYEFEKEQDVDQVGIILNKGVGYSPDGLIGDNGCLEIKCLAPANHVACLLKNAMPDLHKPQIHGALVVGEKEWIDFLSYCPGYKPFLVRITPNDYTEKVAKALAGFLEQYDESRTRILG